jgi:hypothetical protein
MIVMKPVRGEGLFLVSHYRESKQAQSSSQPNGQKASKTTKLRHIVALVRQSGV